MKAISARILRGRLAKNIFGTVYNQFVQLIVQFAAVPILTSHWGVANYGTWLLLFTIPSYMAMADLGFSSAAGNDMTMQVARGDREAAAATFSALRRLVTITSGVIGLGAILVLYVILPHALAFAEGATGGHANETAMLLIGYGVLSLRTGARGAGYRATDGFAICIYIVVTTVMLEAVAGLGCVIAGGGLFEAAIAYFAVRGAGNVALAVVLRRRTPWLYAAEHRAPLRQLRQHVKPALAVMAIPAAQAFSIQGLVVVIGAALGPAAIPAFTTVRTLTRTALQFTFTVNTASLPGFSVAYAKHDELRKTQLILLSLATSAVLLIPAVPVLLFAGREIVHIWTHGVVSPPFSLIALLTLAMLLNGAWMPLGNFILAINRHGGFSYHYLGFSLVAIGLGYVLASHFGASGAAAALVVGEALMVARVLQLARRLDLVDLHLWRQVVRSGIGALRGGRGGASKTA